MIICRQKMSIMFNEICINEEMLTIYIYIYIYIYSNSPSIYYDRSKEWESKTVQRILIVTLHK